MDGDILHEIEKMEWEGGRGGAMVWYFVNEFLIPANKLIGDNLEALDTNDEARNKIVLAHYCLLNGLDKLSKKLAEWENHGAWSS